MGADFLEIEARFHHEQVDSAGLLLPAHEYVYVLICIDRFAR